MKKFFLLLPIILMSASCGLGGNSIVAGTVRTANGGLDWQFMNKIQGGKATINSLSVSKMGFDPNDRQKVYVGGYNGGLYAWDDPSSSWKEILSNILVYDFEVSPADGKVIYAAGLFNNHGRLLITKDGGATWTQVFNDASQDNPVRALALNPYNVNQIIIGLGNGSIIKSSDGGLSWQLTKDFGDRVNRMLWQSNNLYVLLQTKGLFTSADFGNSFQPISTNLAVATSTNSSAVGFTYNQFFVDSVTPNLIYLTTNLGLYKTTDGGVSWNNVKLPIDTGGSVTRGLAIANSSSNIVFTNIGSTIYKTVDGGNTWQTQKVATNGIINYILIDPQLPQISWAGIYGSQ